jgi:iron(III) transport system permease protein
LIKELPLGTEIAKASVLQIGKELEESSFVSGASGTRTFHKIVVPLLLPAILATALRRAGHSRGVITFFAIVAAAVSLDAGLHDGR